MVLFGRKNFHLLEKKNKSSLRGWTRHLQKKIDSEVLEGVKVWRTKSALEKINLNIGRSSRALESSKSRGTHRTVSNINTNTLRNCKKKLNLFLHKTISVCFIWSVLIHFIFWMWTRGVDVDWTTEKYFLSFICFSFATFRIHHPCYNVAIVLVLMATFSINW